MTFEDLVFIERKDFFGGTRARMDFPNGYGISVITGPNAYCDDGTYEVAVFKNGDLCYDTDITDDVIGYVTPEGVTDLMKRIAALEETK